MSLPDTEVAVIGAGTYGVSVALALHERGIDTRLYGRPFSLWFDHTLPNFSLRSDALSCGIHGRGERFSFSSWLRGRAPPAAVRRWMMRRIPGPMFRAYLRWVLAAMPVEAVPDSVTSLAQRGGVFHVETQGGEAIRARRVVVATGIQNHVHVPACLGGLGSRVVHSWDAKTVAGMHAKRVLVVGGGQSAAETCLLLAPTNRVTWVHRSRLEFFNEPLGLPRPAFHVAYQLSKLLPYLPSGLRASIGDPFTRATIVPALRPRLRHASIHRVQADAVDLGLAQTNGDLRSDVLDEGYDRVVACTGYRVGLRSLPFLSDGLRSTLSTAHDQPELDARFQTCVPGLHMVGGLAVDAHGAAQRFMFGSRAAAEGVVRAVAP